MVEEYASRTGAGFGDVGLLLGIVPVSLDLYWLSDVLYFFLFCLMGYVEDIWLGRLVRIII